jgi:2-oxoglutarate ferredoxin oxidoreductase subunit delta
MAGKITIDAEGCKGCGLCVAVCPTHGIAISTASNKKGYFPAQRTNSDCTGCAVCAIICPDAVIEVFRNSNITDLKQDKKNKPGLIRDKK